MQSGTKGTTGSCSSRLFKTIDAAAAAPAQQHQDGRHHADAPGLGDSPRTEADTLLYFLREEKGRMQGKKEPNEQDLKIRDFFRRLSLQEAIRPEEVFEAIKPSPTALSKSDPSVLSAKSEVCARFLALFPRLKEDETETPERGGDLFCM